MLACSPAPTAQCTRQAVIYDLDDRIEAEAYPAGADLIASSVALIAASQVQQQPDGMFALRGGTLASTRNVCSEESFRDQPTVASCSGVLIDDDLVLTAGHCFKRRPENRPVAEAIDIHCADYRYVFGYRLTNGAVAPIPAENVFACRRLVVARQDEDHSDPWLDYAIVQLDRRATPQQRVMPLALDYDPQPGERLILYGYPDGLPLKVDSNGRVRSRTGPQGDYFLAALDAFKGNSGSPVLTEGGAVGGILRFGLTDYEEDPCGRGCVVSSRVQANVVRGVTEKIGETVGLLRPIIAALCDHGGTGTGWPSPRLCKDSQVVCPDTICSPSEHGRCLEDCPPPQCRDRVCELTEQLEGSCPEDCSRISNAPESWVCPGGYGAGDGCNCNCGAFDPDCADAAASQEACGSNAFCNRDGNCQQVPEDEPPLMSELPRDWDTSRTGCDATYYGDERGCDCNCGAPDIDCDNPDPQKSHVLNCAAGQTCSAEGRCEGSELPPGWDITICPAETHEDTMTCHCECGGIDPDCGWQVPVANCPDGWNCMSGRCRNPEAPPPITFTGTLSPRQESRHVAMVQPTARVEVELVPVGGDADLYIGDSTLTRQNHEDASLGHNTATERCQIDNVTTARDVHLLIVNHETEITVSYTATVRQ